MFGFMFGDVAQGAIVAIAGFFLGKRMPALRLLLPGGLVAIVFGFAFGSVFAREDVVPALWLHPLSQPLPVLAVALGFGVVTLVLGLALDALQYFWRGQLRHWLLCDAGLLVAYLGLVGTAIDMRALWLLPLGIAWSLAGAAFATPAARPRPWAKPRASPWSGCCNSASTRFPSSASARLRWRTRACARPSSAWPKPRDPATGRS